MEYIGQLEGWIEERDPLPEECQRAERRSRRYHQPIRVWIIEQVRNARASAVVRVHKRSPGRESTPLDVIVIRIEIVFSDAAAHQPPALDLIAEPEAWLNCRQVGVRRPPRLAAYLRKQQRAVKNRNGRELRAIDLLIHGIHDVRIEAAVNPVVPLIRREIEIDSDPEIQCQFAGHFPVVLHVWRDIAVDGGGEYVVVGARSRGRAQQPGRERVSAERVGHVVHLLRECLRIREAPGIASVLIVVLDLAHVDAALESVRSMDLGDGRVKGPGICVIETEIAAQALVIVKLVTAEPVGHGETVDGLGREPELRWTEAGIGVAARSFDVAIERQPQVRDECRSDRTYPVDRVSIVDALERELPVGAGAANAIGWPHLGAVV